MSGFEPRIEMYAVIIVEQLPGGHYVIQRPWLYNTYDEAEQHAEAFVKGRHTRPLTVYYGKVFVSGEVNG